MAAKEMKALIGNTYPIKEQIKKVGGKWDAANKQWLVPAASWERLNGLIPAVTPKSDKAIRAEARIRSQLGGFAYAMDRYDQDGDDGMY